MSGTVGFRESLVSRGSRRNAGRSTVGLLRTTAGKEGGELGGRAWFIRGPPGSHSFLLKKKCGLKLHYI